jgi:hypothetical protein
MSESQGRNEGFYILPEILSQAIPASSPEFNVGAPAIPQSRKLFAVETRISVEQHGTILAPGFKPGPDQSLRIGDRVRLKCPDGSALRATIGGLDFFHPGPNGEWALLVGLPESEVPVGTEVWSA